MGLWIAKGLREWFMKKHGKTAGEAWEVCHEALRLRMERFPKIKRWLFGRIMYSGILRKRMRKLAEIGKQLRFGDFEVRYVIGDEEDFDFGVDYVACGTEELVFGYSIPAMYIT